VSKIVENLTKLRDLPDVELEQALARVRDELFRLKLGMHTNQVASTASVSTKRREVAQILTILRRRQLGLETQAKGKAADAGPAKKTRKRAAKAQAAEE
jgi:large subunit ribosomal protein L29